MGTLWCLRQEREEGTCLNTRMSLHGLILVFEMRGIERVEGRVVGGGGKGRGTTQTVESDVQDEGGRGEGTLECALF